MVYLTTLSVFLTVFCGMAQWLVNNEFGKDVGVDDFASITLKRLRKTSSKPEHSISEMRFAHGISGTQRKNCNRSQVSWVMYKYLDLRKFL
jgi:hypothetical protein